MFQLSGFYCNSKLSESADSIEDLYQGLQVSGDPPRVGFWRPSLSRSLSEF